MKMANNTGRRVGIFGAGLLLLTTLFIGCGQQTVRVESSWHTKYTNLRSLKADADLVAHGTITSIKAQTIEGGDIPFTDFTFVLADVLHDPHGRVSDANGKVTATSITIHQTGGLVKGQVVEHSDDPLFTVGEEAVLFLHEYKPGYFYVIGGPGGRFHVQNMMVSHLHDEGFQFQTMPLADFITQVRQA